jgi:hypothetical protein
MSFPLSTPLLSILPCHRLIRTPLNISFAVGSMKRRAQGQAWIEETEGKSLRSDEAIEDILQSSRQHRSGSYAIHSQLDQIPLPSIQIDGIEDVVALPLPTVVANVCTHARFSIISTINRVTPLHVIAINLSM